MDKKHDRDEKHIRIYDDRSEYHLGEELIETFSEGIISSQSKQRSKIIKEAFESGFLDSIILNIKAGKTNLNMEKVSPVAEQCLRELVDLLTSEAGRALIGLSVMQLSIKAIEPEQNIRLHKGSASRAAFSWVEGISMRSLDRNYVTPTLRKHNLLRLNADGFMMTRSLAENYPYSQLYKANMRGAKDQWLTLVEELESKATDPLQSLTFFLSLLSNAVDAFSEKADLLISTVEKELSRFGSKEKVCDLMMLHAESSDYAARPFEVSMHALIQAAIESGSLGEVTVKPLSQMRSANKKHGNIGDIELLEGSDIVESWDAKYGKGYLREELEEAVEKLPSHDLVEIVGFVTNAAIERIDELRHRMDDVSALHSVKFEILTYNEWVDLIYRRCLSTNMVNEEQLSNQWLRAYAESLAQKKRDVAPIDEPCLQWVECLTEIITSDVMLLK